MTRSTACINGDARQIFIWTRIRTGRWTTSTRTRSSRKTMRWRSPAFWKGSPRRRSSARSSAVSAFTIQRPRTGPSCTWTRDRGKRAGNLFIVVLDVVFFHGVLGVFQRELGVVNSRVVVVAEPRILFDAEHTSAQTLLQRSARLAFLIAVLREVRTTPALWRLVGTKVSVIASDAARARLTIWTALSSGGTSSHRRSGTAAHRRTRAGESSRAHRRPRFTRTRFADRQRAAFEWLAVELLDCAFGDAPVVVINECKSARATRFAIGGNDDLHRIANRAEVLFDIRFGRAIREIADE